MKTLIIYTSTHHGNTKKLGDAMKAHLNADMIEAKDAKTDALKDYDLVGFGSGIYGGSFHKDVLEFIDRLPDHVGKKAFVFSTSGLGKIKYNNSAVKKLNKKGFEIVGSFACKGFNTFGPFKLIGGTAKGRPNSDDLRAAEAFADDIARKFNV